MRMLPSKFHMAKTLLTLTKYVIKSLCQLITSLLSLGNRIIYWAPIIFANILPI